jgi:hypothetical protein
MIEHLENLEGIVPIIPHWAGPSRPSQHWADGARPRLVAVPQPPALAGPFCCGTGTTTWWPRRPALVVGLDGCLEAPTGSTRDVRRNPTNGAIEKFR